MLEAIGAFTVGLLALTVILFLLQYLYETALAVIGYRRVWNARFRQNGKLTKPFPWRAVVRVCARLDMSLNGYWDVGSLRIPVDPRLPVTRSSA